jgi:hypothetical protein
LTIYLQKPVTEPGAKIVMSGDIQCDGGGSAEYMNAEAKIFE